MTTDDIKTIKRRFAEFEYLYSRLYDAIVDLKEENLPAGIQDDLEEIDQRMTRVRLWLRYRRQQSKPALRLALVSDRGSAGPGGDHEGKPIE
jgi:hypothetical protein